MKKRTASRVVAIALVVLAGAAFIGMKVLGWNPTSKAAASRTSVIALVTNLRGPDASRAAIAELPPETGMLRLRSVVGSEFGFSFERSWRYVHKRGFFRLGRHRFGGEM